MNRLPIILITLFGILVVTPLFPGCAGQHKTVEEPKADFILAFNPLKDDPDNPSPHNPLIKKFGDIPQVRTYIRLKQKYISGAPLTIDEAIELYTADLYLYQSKKTKEHLKRLKQHKKELETGLTIDNEYKYTGTTVYDFSGDSPRVWKQHPDGSKTFYNKDGSTIEVLPHGKSPDVTHRTAKTIGVGDSSVYLYYYLTHQEHARSQGNSVWHCRIDKMDSDPREKARQQIDLHKEFSEYPIVALIIKTDEPYMMEEAIHDILKSRGKHMQEAPGIDWFLTSPSEVEEIYEKKIGNLNE